MEYGATEAIEKLSNLHLYLVAEPHVYTYGSFLASRISPVVPLEPDKFVDYSLGAVSKLIAAGRIPPKSEPKELVGREGSFYQELAELTPLIADAIFDPQFSLAVKRIYEDMKRNNYLGLI